MVAQHPEKVSAINVLATLNQLSLQAYLTTTFESLIFQIVNDTQHVIFYNRAMLWQWDEDKIKLLSISGQTEVNMKSALVENSYKLLKQLQNPEKAQILTTESFSSTVQKEWVDIQEEQTQPVVFWIPLYCNKKIVAALWLERWHKQDWPQYEQELLGFICATYGAVWDKFRPKFLWKKIWRYWTIFSIVAVLALLLIRIPLRIVAPCEIVAENPMTITAPLEGIISHLSIKPGDELHVGDLLFEYNKEEPLQNLRATQKQVEICESELNRAVSLAFTESSLLSEVEILALKLRKEKIALDIAQYQAKKLSMHAPTAGIVMLDDPEKWRGHPVNIGEKILQICNPNRTKVHLWIPESDNVLLDPNIPLKVFLNVHPEKSIGAHLKYIASYSQVSEKGMPSFLAEANWLDTAPEIKLGLKGSAILYGEDVSLFYWIIRRPWTATRNFLGF